MDRLWKDAKPQYERWLASINALIDHQEALIQWETKTAMSEAATFLHVMLGAMALALVCGVALAWVVARSVTAPLARAVAATHRISQGDLSGPIEVDRQDELGALQRALAGMQQSLSTVVGHVRANSESVATASTQIAQGNQHLSQRTEEPRPARCSRRPPRWSSSTPPCATTPTAPGRPTSWPRVRR